MPISAIYFLDNHYKRILSRDYRGEFISCSHDQRKPCVECDPVEVFTEEHAKFGVPLFYSKEIDKTIANIHRNGIYVMSPICNEGDVSSVFVFLHKVVNVMKYYFGVFTEEALKDNFTIVYEILDEMIDFGYVQTTDEKYLQKHVLQKGVDLFSSEKITYTEPSEDIPWRRENIFHAKNEVYLDVVERINATFDEEGKVILSEISGSILVNCRLSGMPVVNVGLNDGLMLPTKDYEEEKENVNLENINFHPCVDLSQFEHNRTISFIPPDGSFELFSYIFQENIIPPLFVNCEVEEYSGTRVVYKIKAVSKLTKDFPIVDVFISVPIPEDADSPVFKTKHGSVKYFPEENVFVWKIKTIPFGKEIEVFAQIGLPRIRVTSRVQKKPLLVKFRSPYFCLSGLQIKYLKITERSGYQSMTWVRYLTKEGNYSVWLKEVV